MSNVMRAFLIVTGITAMLVIGFAGSASATDWGRPPGAPTITCDHISIDPPLVPWISVTFSGDVDGAAFTKTVTYGAPTPHIATADITDLTTATGPLHITASATWTLGSGSSDVADVTLTCKAAPPVTTEGVTVTSAPATTTTTTVPATTSTMIAPSTASLATGATPPRSSLPLTGASTRPLATTGALAVLAGLAAALGTKRRRKHTT
jgi:LPXTG-motif cell wall-anchored protein